MSRLIPSDHTAYDRMSAEIKRLIPEGLKHYKAERSKPHHDPPLCFCPSKTPENEDGDDNKDDNDNDNDNNDDNEVCKQQPPWLCLCLPTT